MVSIFFKIIYISIFLLFTSHAKAEMTIIDTKIDKVAINGGSDSPVAGVSCFRMKQKASDRCGNGWIAIPNNNKELLNAIFDSKVNRYDVRVIYYDEQPQLKCPSIVYTNCQLESVLLN